MSSDRGQAYTLEGVIGAIVIASALVLGIQAVNVEPWTDDGPEQGTEIRAQVVDVLEIAQDRGALKTAVTCLGGTDSPKTPHPAVVATDPNVTELDTILNDTLAQSANYAVYVDHYNGSHVNRTVLGREPAPTGASVTVTRRLVLFDNDPIYELQGGTCQPRGDTLGDPDREIYLSDESEGELYAVVQIRVVAW